MTPPTAHAEWQFKLRALGWKIVAQSQGYFPRFLKDGDFTPSGCPALMESWVKGQITVFLVKNHEDGLTYLYVPANTGDEALQYISR